MKWIIVRRIPAIAFALGALIVLGCSEDPTEPKGPSAPRYPETTSPEIVIDNLLLSFKDRNLEQFEKLLHTDYIWYNQAGVMPQYYTRSEDIQITGNMFDAALHVYADEALWLEQLKLVIDQTAPHWLSVSDIAGDPCEDCWETTREYYITLATVGGARIYLGSDMVKFVVIGVDRNGTKIYQFLRADDINQP